MLGNWTEQRTDLTGNGVFTDALDRSDARSHNLIELLGRAGIEITFATTRRKRRVA